MHNKKCIILYYVITIKKKMFLLKVAQSANAVEVVTWSCWPDKPDQDLGNIKCPQKQ